MAKKVKELKPVFASRLGEAVIMMADQPDGKNRNRRKLFFQVEPFAREFGEYPTEPLTRDNYDEHADWINRHIQRVKSQHLLTYRPMFFGWLSYYHPTQARELIRLFDPDIPLYAGHPDLSGCSKEAKEYFVKQVREEEPERHKRQKLRPVASSFNKAKIQKILEQHKSGVSATDLCVRYGVRIEQIYDWKVAFEKIDDFNARLMCDLEQENVLLRRLLANHMIEIEKERPEKG